MMQHQRKILKALPTILALGSPDVLRKNYWDPAIDWGTVVILGLLWLTILSFFVALVFALISI